MINKELLREILGDSYTELVEEIKIKDNLLQIYYICSSEEVSTCLDEINLYEFTHKCKKWIFNQGYVLSIALTCKNYPALKEEDYDCIIEDFHSYYEEDTPAMQFVGASETETILKACEWVLNQKKRKYELIEKNDKGLYRIKSLKDFGIVKTGEIGGFVENESNLSQEGNCWIYDDAIIRDNAKVLENAEVFNNSEIGEYAVIKGNTTVQDNVKILGNAIIKDNVNIWGDVIISDNAIVCGNTRIFGNAIIKNNAFVCDKAIVCDDAIITNNAYIGGNAIIDGKMVIENNIKIIDDINLLLNKE